MPATPVVGLAARCVKIASDPSGEEVAEAAAEVVHPLGVVGVLGGGDELLAAFAGALDEAELLPGRQRVLDGFLSVG